MKRRKMVVGLGELLWDIYPDGKYVGGATANVAVHAHRLGAEGIIVSAVGNDEMGDELHQRLKAWGLDTSAIQRCETHPTGSVQVILDQRGVPRFECSWDTAFDQLRYDDVLKELARSADAVVVGTFDQRNEVARETTQRFLAEAAKPLKVFDVNFRSWDESMRRIVVDTLAYADILKFSEDEMKKMQAAFGRSNKGMIPFLEGVLDEFGLKLVALSLGERGCMLVDGHGTVVSQGIHVPVVDTTGCGDAFVAGLTLKYAEGAPSEEIAEFANAMGAFVATRKGATPEYTSADLERFRQAHWGRFAFHL